MACINKRIITNSTIKRMFQAGFLNSPNMEVSCGKCINCKVVKQSQLAFLCNKELQTVYASGRGAAFVTLTYTDSNVPINNLGKLTLRKNDMKLFIKRLRRSMEYHGDKTPFKTIYAGEYGGKMARPHYHIVFLGLTDSQVRKYSRKCWKLGICQIGALRQGGIRYVTKYITKGNPSKKVAEIYEKYKVEKPFIYHSIGLAREWILNNIQKIADSNFQFRINGKITPYPKYICQYVSLRTGKDYRKIFAKMYNEKQYQAYCQNHIRPDYWENYQALIQARAAIIKARQDGIPVDDTLPQNIIVPKVDTPDNKLLVDEALFGDVVPF